MWGKSRKFGVLDTIGSSRAGGDHKANAGIVTVFICDALTAATCVSQRQRELYSVCCFGLVVVVHGDSKRIAGLRAKPHKSSR